MTNAAPSESHDALRAALVAIIYETTRREPAPGAAVTDATPCVGGDLLQDSLDVLEFVVTIDRVYGVSIRDADAGREALKSLGDLTAYVAANRVR